MSHIALVLPDLVAGGAQRVFLALAREFVALGHRIDLLLLHKKGELQSIVPDGIRITYLHDGQSLGGQAWLAVNAVIKLSRWLRQQCPDALLCTVTGTNLVTAVAWGLAGSRPRLGIREVSSLRNVNSRARIWGMRCIYPHADIVIVLTGAMADEMTRVIGVSPSHVALIPNPIDRALLIEKSREPVDHPWLVEKLTPIIVSVGRLTPAKDQPTLLRAFAKLTQSYSARLLIIGEGPARESIEAMIKELGLEDRVYLCGFETNPWRLMAHADLYVLSSQWEGHPNSLLEALALRLPTISTAYDKSAKDMAMSFGFCTVPPGDAEALAEVMGKQLCDPKLPVNLGAIPDVKAIAQRYLEVLQVGPETVANEIQKKY